MPKANLTIDETMIAYKGRHSEKIYMPCKPTKFGFKAFMLCESDTGYVLNSIFDFKDWRENYEMNISNIIERLIEGYKDDGYILFTDRYYTSPKLFLKLKSKGVLACGTVKQNRV